MQLKINDRDNQIIMSHLCQHIKNNEVICQNE
jgi:hypothetical protein